MPIRRIEPETIEEKVEAAAAMAMHAMMASASAEILASVAIAGVRPTASRLHDMVAARAMDEHAFRMIMSKVEDCLTIAEQLRADGGGS